MSRTGEIKKVRTVNTDQFRERLLVLLPELDNSEIARKMRAMAKKSPAKGTWLCELADQIESLEQPYWCGKENLIDRMVEDLRRLTATMEKPLFLSNQIVFLSGKQLTLQEVVMRMSAPVILKALVADEDIAERVLLQFDVELMVRR